MEPDELLTPAAAAERLKLYRTSIYALIRRRELKPVTIGGHLYLRAADVDALAAQGERKPGRPKKSAPEPEGEVSGDA